MSLPPALSFVRAFTITYSTTPFWIAPAFNFDLVFIIRLSQSCESLTSVRLPARMFVLVFMI